METILVKIFATALALSEVTTQPQAVKTHFDAVRDRTEVVQLLRDGCAHMRQAFDIESVNLDDLIATALNDPKSAGSDRPEHRLPPVLQERERRQAGCRSRPGHRVFQQRGSRSARPDAA